MKSYKTLQAIARKTAAFQRKVNGMGVVQGELGKVENYTQGTREAAFCKLGAIQLRRQDLNTVSAFTITNANEIARERPGGSKPVPSDPKDDPPSGRWSNRDVPTGHWSRSRHERQFRAGPVWFASAPHKHRRSQKRSWDQRT